MKLPIALSILCLIAFQETGAKEITTNEVVIQDAPNWLTQTRVEKVTDRIQQKLEWTTRKVKVRFYDSPESYAKAQSLGPKAVAVTINANGTSTVHFGPKVTDELFDEIFAHELVHVIIFQKYKDAIPKWLEEGLANHLAKRGRVDYRWLAKQPYPSDVKQLAHPFSGSSDGISYRYKASQAVAEMLNKKCDLENLIRLSVQRKMENYIETYCEIKDLNMAFKDWVKKQSTGI